MKVEVMWVEWEVVSGVCRYSSVKQVPGEKKMGGGVKGERKILV